MTRQEIETAIKNKTVVSLESKRFDRRIRKVVLDSLNEPVENLFILTFSRVCKDRSRGYTYFSKHQKEIFTRLEKLESAVTVFRG